jgi:hypothetical protein
MSGGRPRSTLDGVKGDLLPHRRQVSARAQYLTIGILALAVAVVFFVYL